jgi:hypothetical protein
MKRSSWPSVALLLWASTSALACGRGSAPTGPQTEPVTPSPATATATAELTSSTATTRTLYTTILGRPMGTLVVVRAALPDGGERWTTTTTMTLALDDPGESASTTTIVDVSEYGPDKQLRTSDETSTEGAIVERTRVRIADGSLSIAVEGPSHDTGKSLPLPADFASDRVVYDRLRREVDEGAALPHSITYSTFDDDSMAFEPATMTLVARSTATVDGVEVPTWKVELRDAEGERTAAELDLSGMPLSFAMGAFTASMTQTEDAPDIKLSSYLPIDGFVPRGVDALRVVVTIADEDPADAPVFKDSPYHTVERDAGAYTLSLRANRGATLNPAKLPLASIPDDVRPFLAPTPTSQSDHRAIVERARTLVDGVNDSREAARRITMWVHDNLGKRDGTRGAATAVETLEAGFGDCTEHAALTVALLRAAGLPARNVSGVVLVPGFFSADAGYHAWAEVWIGEWIALDPALGSADVAAHYLHLGYDEPGMPSGSGGLSRMLGRSKITVQSS